jgi:hypothetical protein
LTEISQENDHPAWLKLKAMHERGDIDKLENMVKFWESLEAFGRLGDMLRRALIWLGAIFAAYFVFTEYIAKFIRKTAGLE